jgi:hypothetical protein
MIIWLAAYAMNVCRSLPLYKRFDEPYSCSIHAFTWLRSTHKLQIAARLVSESVHVMTDNFSL